MGVIFFDALNQFFAYANRREFRGDWNAPGHLFCFPSDEGMGVSIKNDGLDGRVFRVIMFNILR